MRFPWLQVDTDFIDAKAGELGVLLGISRREAMGLAIDLWKWVLSRSPSDRPPDGVLSGTAPVPVLASAVSWPDPEQLVSALEEVGMLERLPNGLRMRGIRRYEATWKKNRANPGRNRAGTGPVSHAEPVPKTQTQTQTQKEEDLPAPEGREAPQQPGLFPQPARRPPEDTRRKARQRPASEPTGDPRHQPLVAALCEAAPGYAFLGGQDAKAVKRLLELADSDPMTRGDKAPGEVVRRWRICRAWVGFPASRHLGDFATNWNAYAKPQDAAVRPGRMDTRPSDFSVLPEGGVDLDTYEVGT